MKKRNNNVLVFLQMIFIIMLLLNVQPTKAFSALTAGKTVVTLGNDLTPTQKEEMLQILGAPKDTTPLIITNREEHKALGKYLAPEVIGNRAISSAKVALGEPGSGLKVATINITWVTKEMYANALLTAGVRDAEVTVAAPFPASGTAALTGIIKAFETATETKLSSDRVDAATEELIKTSELGKQIGNPQKAAELVAKLKNQLGKANPQTDEEYRALIQKIAQDLGVSLTEEQVNSLVDLLKKLRSLNIDWGNLATQLSNIYQRFNELFTQNPEVRSLWERFVNFLRQIVQAISQYFH